MVNKYPIDPADIEVEEAPPQIISGEGGDTPTDVSATKSSASSPSPFSISGCDDHDDARFCV